MSDQSKRVVTLPLSSQDARSLRAGDAVLLSGPVFTMRDAGHMRTLEVLESSGELPFDLTGQTLFYAGPTPGAAGRPVGSVGPTTSRRMDFAAPALYRAGIAATIGKGERDSSISEACRETGSVYFVATGGAAALLATRVSASELVAWGDLGTEALYRLELEEFPVFVAVDTRGADLFEQVAEECR